MPRYLLKLSYSGTRYSGWQTQPDGNTIQDKLEKALSTILGERTRLKGASRTDSGVHALDQHATFDSETVLNLRKLNASLCGLLPEDIRVIEIEQVRNNFDVINENRGKAYIYRIWNHNSPHPFLNQFVWHLKTHNLDEAEIRNTITKFVGTKNFRAYAASDGSAKTFERTIFEIDLRVRGHYFEFWFSGEGFLKQMIRNIVGTLVDVSRGAMSDFDIDASFHHGNRERTGLCAPASGLCLQKIFYDKRPQIRDLQIEFLDRAAISI